MSRYTFLFKKYSKKLEKFYDPTLVDGSGEDIDRETQTEDLFEKLWALDPTPKKSRVDAILQWYINSPIKDEDLYKITENLELFEIYKTHFSQKDLMSYKTYQDFFNTVYPVLEEIQNSDSLSLSENQKEKLYKQEMLKQTEILEETNDYILLTPLTQEASCYWGRGTQWCTAATRSNNMFDHYHSSGPLRIILEKKTAQNPNPTKYQFHLSSSQFMNVHDHEINAEEFASLEVLTSRNPNSILEKYFQYLSWKDQAFFSKKYKPLEEGQDLINIIKTDDIQRIISIYPENVTKEMLEKAIRRKVMIPLTIIKKFKNDKDIYLALKENAPGQFIRLYQFQPETEQDIIDILKKKSGYIEFITPKNMTSTILSSCIHTIQERSTLSEALEKYLLKTENPDPYLKNIYAEEFPMFYLEKYGYVDSLPKHSAERYFIKLLQKINEDIPLSEKEQNTLKDLITKGPCFESEKDITLFKRDIPKQKFPKDLLDLLKKYQPFFYTTHLYSKHALNDFIKNKKPFPKDTKAESFEERCLNNEKILDVIYQKIETSQKIAFLERLLDHLPKEKTQKNFEIFIRLFSNFQETYQNSSTKKIFNEQTDIVHRILKKAEDFVQSGYSRNFFNINKKNYPNYEKNFPALFTETQQEIIQRIRTANTTENDIQNPYLHFSTLEKEYVILDQEKSKIDEAFTKNPHTRRFLKILYETYPNGLFKRDSKDAFSCQETFNFLKQIPVDILQEDYTEIQKNKTLFADLTFLFADLLEENGKRSFERRKNPITKDDLVFLKTIKNDIKKFYQNNPEKLTDLFKDIITGTLDQKTNPEYLKFAQNLYTELSRENQVKVKRTLFSKIDGTNPEYQGVLLRLEKLSPYYKILLEEIKPQKSILYGEKTEIRDSILKFCTKLSLDQQKDLYQDFFQHRLTENQNTLPFENLLRKTVYILINDYAKDQTQKDILTQYLFQNLPKDPEKIKDFFVSYCENTNNKSEQIQNISSFVKKHFPNTFTKRQHLEIDTACQAIKFYDYKTLEEKKDLLLKIAHFIRHFACLENALEDIKREFYKSSNKSDMISFYKTFGEKIQWEKIEKNTWDLSTETVKCLIVAELYSENSEFFSKIPHIKKAITQQNMDLHLISFKDIYNELQTNQEKDKLIRLFENLYKNESISEYRNALKRVFPNLEERVQESIERQYFEKDLEPQKDFSDTWQNYNIPKHFEDIRKKFTEKQMQKETIQNCLRSPKHERFFQTCVETQIKTFKVKYPSTFPFEIIPVDPKSLDSHREGFKDPKLKILNPDAVFSLKDALQLYLDEIQYTLRKKISTHSVYDDEKNAHRFSKIGSTRLEERQDLLDITQKLKHLLNQENSQTENFSKKALIFLKKFPLTIHIKKYPEQDIDGNTYQIPFSISQNPILAEITTPNNKDLQKRLLERGHAVPDNIHLTDKLESKFQIILKHIPVPENEKSQKQSFCLK